MLTYYFLHRDIEAVYPETGTVSVSEQHAIATEAGLWRFELTIDATCDEIGMSYTGYRFTTEYASWGGGHIDFEGPSGTVTYDTPVLMVPATLTPGDVWSTARTRTIVPSSGDTYTVADDSIAEVIGIEEVEVPLGTYTAVRVDETSPSGTVSMWYADGVGLVKAGALEMDNYSDGYPVYE